MEGTNGTELSTNQKGAIAEARIVAAAIHLGIEIYRPWSEHGRYDLIFGLGTRLLRVQCKWANKVEDVVVIRAYSCRRTRDGLTRRGYTEEEVDVIAAYCEELGTSYLLPASLFASRKTIHLRLEPSKNNQELRINWAKEYELGAIAQLGER